MMKKGLIFNNAYTKEDYDRDCADDGPLNKIIESISDGEKELKQLEKDFDQMRKDFRRTKNRLAVFRENFSTSLKQKETRIKIRRRQVYAMGKAKAVRKVMFQRAEEVSSAVKSKLDDKTKEYEQSIKEKMR